MHCSPFGTVVEHLVPLFEVDDLLPRSLLALISKQHIKEAYDLDCFPPDALFANLCYFIKTKKVSSHDLTKVSNKPKSTTTTTTK